MRSRSRNASRVQAMSAGAGFRAALASNGRSISHSAPLSGLGGRPAPKPLSVAVQSRRLNQSPESKLFLSKDLLRSRSTPAWKYATPWLNATTAAPRICTRARSPLDVDSGSFSRSLSNSVWLSWFST